MKIRTLRNELGWLFCGVFLYLARFSVPKNDDNRLAILIQIRNALSTIPQD